jgi:hypothetical protein
MSTETSEVKTDRRVSPYKKSSWRARKSILRASRPETMGKNKKKEESEEEEEEEEVESEVCMHGPAAGSLFCWLCFSIIRESQRPSFKGSRILSAQASSDSTGVVRSFAGGV